MSPRNPADEHPELSDDELKAQRGDSPPASIGHTERPDGGTLDPDWTPTSGLADAARRLIGEVGKEHRPRREDVYPYLLIRAFSPGDRGARPTWPPVPCWESPDILLMDAAFAGPFTPAQVVASPTAGRSYRVFVRVFNLGLLQAVGVHVRAWYINPGFFNGTQSDPFYQPVLIGGAMVNLDDRTRPGSVAVVELDRPWTIPADLTGHECLLATATCPLDPDSGTLQANLDRHVGQRNLNILAPQASMKRLFFDLGNRVEKTATLELLHGGPAALPLLQALGGDVRFRTPALEQLRRGTNIGANQHLLTLFVTDRGVVVSDSARLWKAVREFGLVRRRPGAHPFAQPGRTRAFIEKLGLDRVELHGVLLDAEPGAALVEGLVHLWELNDLDAGAVGAALAEGGRTAHLLRLVHTDAERRVGGYSLVAVTP